MGGGGAQSAVTVPTIIRTDSRLKERGSLPARKIGTSVKVSSVFVCPSSATELFPQHPSPLSRFNVGGGDPALKMSADLLSVLVEVFVSNLSFSQL